MSAQTDKEAQTRKALDKHKQNQHNGHYLIGCPECFRLLREWRDSV